MGLAFGSLGTHRIDRPTAGLVVSALIPLAVRPPFRYVMRRRPVVEPPLPEGGTGEAGANTPLPDRSAA